MQVNVLLRGQSNADYFFRDGDMSRVQAQVTAYLGWTGTANTVNILGGSKVTAFGSTTLLPASNSPNPSWLVSDPLSPTGYAPGADETSLLNVLNALPAAQKASPTAVVWFHNETDSWNANENAADWGRGVQADMGMVRSALGQTAITTPYVFMNEPYDWGPGGIAYYGETGLVQSLRAEQFALSATPGLNASMSASIGDQDMNRTDAFFGGQHGSIADDTLVADRMARAVALSLKAYAAPGAPVLGAFDATGPTLTAATGVFGHADQLNAVIALAPGTTGLQALSPIAAQGAGFSAMLADGSLVAATGVSILDGHDLRITFGQDLPATATLYYGYGIGRIALPGQAGEGNAVYDTQALPIQDTPTGIAVSGTTALPIPMVLPTYVVQATASLTLTQDSLVYGGASDSTIALGTTESQVVLASGNATITGGSGRLVAYGGTGTASIVGGSEGGNLLVAGSGTTTLTGTHDDALSAGTGTTQVFVGSGENTVFSAGGTGTAQITASTGTDLVVAGTGSTVVYGGSGAIEAWGTPTDTATMLFQGGSGTSLVLAGQGMDTLMGGTGTSTLVGGLGHASIVGGNGATTVFTGSGPDTVDAGSSTSITEGSGSALILGSSGSTVVFAGSGNTTLSGGTGSMTVYMGSGRMLASDVGPTTYDFLDHASGGSLVVSGFTPGQDHIQGTITSAVLTGQGTMLSMQDGGHAVVLGVSSAHTALFS